jgi:hypothetical protein
MVFSLSKGNHSLESHVEGHNQFLHQFVEIPRRSNISCFLFLLPVLYDILQNKHMRGTFTLYTSMLVIHKHIFIRLYPRLDVWWLHAVTRPKSSPPPFCNWYNFCKHWHGLHCTKYPDGSNMITQYSLRHRRDKIYLYVCANIKRKHDALKVLSSEMDPSEIWHIP